MKFIDNHKQLGSEYDWAALDHQGQIGYFSTAGFGPIPEICEKGLCFETLFEDLLSLPKIGKAITKQIRPQANMWDWQCLSERGIYAYDWSQKKSRYQLLFAPSNSLKIEELPDLLSRQIQKIKLETTFSQYGFLTLDGQPN